MRFGNKENKIVETKEELVIKCSFCNKNDSISSYKGRYCCSNNDCAVKMMTNTNDESVKTKTKINNIPAITPSKKTKKKYKKKSKKKIKMIEKNDNTLPNP